MCVEDFGGQIIGRFYARWLGTKKCDSELHNIADTILKLDQTPTLVVVEVRRFGIQGCPPRYVVRLVGHPGCFGLHEFEWHGDYPVHTTR